MRLSCPICGVRDRREFYYQGDAVALERPAPEAGQAVWDAYLHVRDNPAGSRRELWQHEAGCGAWLVVERHSGSHAVTSVSLVHDRAEETGA
ncbi:sarcosine oxidase subunit delta [uncultured Roseobacter sp.]|uniref:sarcosine oxidase subunit delta n=1 Tax=uncultured Roseobacter sp. TaxID=114847 RepID=UPI002627B3E3|nr:sarcosine oxidase subunit delta [uncultured Roseobacter sp.]